MARESRSINRPAPALPEWLAGDIEPDAEADDRFWT
jgi:hypothetical protein